MASEILEQALIEFHASLHRGAKIHPGQAIFTMFSTNPPLLREESDIGKWPEVYPNYWCLQFRPKPEAAKE